VATLVVMSGLPGTGKSTVARRIAIETDAELLAKDIVEAALWRRGVGREHGSTWVAHEVLTSLASSALQLQRSGVLDTVAGTEAVRRDWRQAAADAGSAFVVIVCECTDVMAHRLRLFGRQRGIEGWPELSWEDVEGTRRRWEPWSEPHLTLDAMDDIEDNVVEAITYVRRHL